MNELIVIMTRTEGAAEALEQLIAQANHSLDAALYRFNHPRLASALAAALARGIRVRVVLDQKKYEESPSSQALFSPGRIPFRVGHGRRGPGSKMHHKFAIIDGQVLVTGSYNWTIESEEQNCEDLVILRDSTQAGVYQQEFEALWAESQPAR
ncbi:MAG: FAM83 family protein [Acidobacteriia bacterium]|nr:FAM83 family protein [Terriglobia bacterium]